LLSHLGPRLKKSLLVLDEAHTVAPASSSMISVDSHLTTMVRDELAYRFENRLFLSATPHNGHSNSFSALMAMLDPQRFTRGVKIQADSKALSAVMVRRLKRDLVALGSEDYPIRKLLCVTLERTGAEWCARYVELGRGKKTGRPTSEVSLGDVNTPEIELSGLLAEYTKLVKPQQRRGQLVFINLQKRLLSSIEAFHRTLEAHAAKVDDTIVTHRISHMAFYVNISICCKSFPSCARPRCWSSAALRPGPLRRSSLGLSRWLVPAITVRLPFPRRRSETSRSTSTIRSARRWCSRAGFGHSRRRSSWAQRR
jgi:hypothetical protein